VDDSEWSGRTSASGSEPLIVQMKNIHGNRRMTVREVAEEVEISIGSCHTVLTEDLGMRRVSSKCVPTLDWWSPKSTPKSKWRKCFD
jgi:hypothetical protein